MENIATVRFDTKIEGFESCIIEGSQPQELSQTITSDTNVQEVSIDECEENHETISLQPAQGDGQINPISSAQPNSQSNVTLTPVRLPAILDGEFFSVIRLEDTNVTARCSQCQKLLNGNLKSTGNFLSHVKRVHPFLLDKIKIKSNQRRPAAIYVDLSQERNPHAVRIKNRYKKFPKAEEYQSMNEESFEQQEWLEQPVTAKKRRSEDVDSKEMLRAQYNSMVAEDEFDAIGRNVAAKLRHMRLDQRIIAEKLLNDILFEAQLGNLQRDSGLNV